MTNDSVTVFDPKKEKFSSYLGRFKAHLHTKKIGVLAAGANEAARNAADFDKVNEFISKIGPEAYEILENLCKPQQPDEKKYDELISLMKGHFIKSKVEIAETFKFHHITQEKGEPIAKYVGRLRGQAADCNYGDFLDRALRDQFVCGLYEKEDQTSLLSETRDIEACIKFATAAEVAREQVTDLRKLQFQTSPQPEVHAMKHVNKNIKYSEKSKLAKSFKSGSQKPTYKCYSCGKSNHKRSECKFRYAECELCKTVGHIKAVCGRRKDLNAIEDDGQSDSDSDNLFSELFMCSEKHANSKKIIVPITIQGRNVQMQLDTGCALSLAPQTFYSEFCNNAPLEPTSTIMSTYTGESIVPLGECTIEVGYADQTYQLPLIIVPEGTCALFGRNWLKHIKLKWEELPGLNFIRAAATSTNPQVQYRYSDMSTLLDAFSNLFDGKLGMYTGPPVDLECLETPKFHKARQVPYALQPQVEAAIRKMEEEGVIKRVNHAPCAAPIVPVVKKDSKDIRICGDFSVTYNKCAAAMKYPIPRIEDLHAAFIGCTRYSVLDMSQAYHQVPVREESQKWLTINTHIGLFTFTRIPNGIHSGPGKFQQIMDSVLAGIPRVICYLDDILVAGVNEEDHLANLAMVFEKLQAAGFKLNKRKCKFQQDSVTYLAHVIDKEGLRPTDEKLKAIRDATAPSDVSSLKSFLGLIMFYSKFLPHHSTVLAPLNKLLQKDVKWKWGDREQKSFKNAKKMLLESETLVHYDGCLPLYLSCDASSYGAGAVLCHFIEGQYRPIAFASVTLTPAQKNYSQIDKEAFSIIFGLQKFHQFLAGREFTIISDHKPLLALFDPHRQTSPHVSARLQRWKLLLASYKYKIVFRGTKSHLDADGMSRVPLPKSWSPKSDNVDCYFLEEDIVIKQVTQPVRVSNRVKQVPGHLKDFVLEH